MIGRHISTMAAAAEAVRNWSIILAVVCGLGVVSALLHDNPLGALGWTIGAVPFTAGAAVFTVALRSARKAMSGMGSILPGPRPRRHRRGARYTRSAPPVRTGD